MRRLFRVTGEWLPHAIVAVDVALILLLAVHLYRGGPIVNNAIDIWFDRSDPTVETLNQERRLFGADTWMLATVWMRADRVDEAGDVARSLTEELERIDGVSRVISPTSIEVLQRDDQGLFFDALDATRQWPALRDKLLRHPFAGDFLVYAKSPEVVLAPDQGAHRTLDAGIGPAAAGLRGQARPRHPSGGRRVGGGRHGGDQRRSQPAVLGRLPAPDPADGRRRLAGAAARCCGSGGARPSRS